MKLSDLIYNTIKSTVYYEDNRDLNKLDIRKYAYSLTTTSIDNEGVTINADYKRTVDNIFLVINDAIQRLASLEKLPLRTFHNLDVLPINESEIYNAINGNVIDLKPFKEEISKIVNVYEIRRDNTFRSLDFVSMGKEKIALKEVAKGDLYVEYYPQVREFTYDDIAYHEDENPEYKIDKDVELEDYGISGKACHIISLYAKGVLGNDIYGTQANLWINQAEAYMQDLEDYAGTTPHFQNEVEGTYHV